ncbi:Hypothetical protein ETEE_3913 [Edwardsiella anguillarum ET080813]|uniref:Uncharacterized protein n=1 Tax=Edwardsiella anguillarum ET080813 TaxID=667120 RepID=A0A076LUG0_9GAMM|nr:Hypothetical protein ETEE_3913 [Edwardsiella anguillarum ET080813]
MNDNVYQYRLQSFFASDDKNRAQPASHGANCLITEQIIRIGGASDWAGRQCTLH